MNTRNRPTPSASATLRAAALALLLIAGAGTARAERWTWTITPYAWATDVGVNATLDGRTVMDETIPVSDLLEYIDMILQGRVVAQKGSLGVMLDVFYVSMSDEVAGIALPQGAGAADLQSEFGMAITDIAGIYDPRGDRKGLSLLYGARIIDEWTTVDATFHMASGASAARQYQTRETLVDGLAGIRFATALKGNLSAQMQADVSIGGTRYTWSAFPSLSYAFGKAGQFAINTGYRRMAIDFEEDAGVDADMTLSGPVLGFRMSF